MLYENLIENTSIYEIVDFTPYESSEEAHAVIRKDYGNAEGYTAVLGKDKKSWYIVETKRS